MEEIEFEKELERVRTVFINDRFPTLNGAVIDKIGDYYAECSIMLKDRHKNAVDSIMGGVMFTLADFTFAVATNWKEMRTVSLNANITFLGVVKGKQLIAKAKRIKDGRTTCYYQVEVTDELGTQVAAVTITGYHKK